MSTPPQRLPYSPFRHEVSLVSVECCLTVYLLSTCCQRISDSVLQDLLALETWPVVRPALEETVNDPVVPRHYWRYRMHVTLREMDTPKLLSTVQKLLLSSGRCFHDRLPALHVDDAKEHE